ncbi:unnamed protein product [Scytosiphon promiscuus]
MPSPPGGPVADPQGVPRGGPPGAPPRGPPLLPTPSPMNLQAAAAKSSLGPEADLAPPPPPRRPVGQQEPPPPPPRILSQQGAGDGRSNSSTGGGAGLPPPPPPRKISTGAAGKDGQMSGSNNINGSNDSARSPRPHRPPQHSPSFGPPGPPGPPPDHPSMAPNNMTGGTNNDNNTSSKRGEETSPRGSPRGHPGRGMPPFGGPPPQPPGGNDNSFGPRGPAGSGNNFPRPGPGSPGGRGGGRAGGGGMFPRPGMPPARSGRPPPQQQGERNLPPAIACQLKPISTCPPFRPTSLALPDSQSTGPGGPGGGQQRPWFPPSFGRWTTTLDAWCSGGRLHRRALRKPSPTSIACGEISSDTGRTSKSALSPAQRGLCSAPARVYVCACCQDSPQETNSRDRDTGTQDESCTGRTDRPAFALTPLFTMGASNMSPHALGREVESRCRSSASFFSNCDRAAFSPPPPSARSRRTQAHAKRVAAENKRSRRFALGGGLGAGRLRASRPKIGNSRGKVVKAFVADSDDDESEEVGGWRRRVPRIGSWCKQASSCGYARHAWSAPPVRGLGAEGIVKKDFAAVEELAADRVWPILGVGLGAAVALSQASNASEVDEETKITIRQTAEWFHANPDKSKIVMEKSRGNAQFSFLFDASSPGGRFYRQVLEEIKTEEEVKRVCSGFGEANASDYGPTPQDSSNVYGPGAGLAAAAANGAAGGAGGGGAAAAIPGGGGLSWAAAKPAAMATGAEGGGGGAARGTAGANAAEIVAQISAQVAMRSASTFGAAPTPSSAHTAATRARKNRWGAGAGGAVAAPATGAPAAGLSPGAPAGLGASAGAGLGFGGGVRNGSGVDEASSAAAAGLVAAAAAASSAGRAVVVGAGGGAESAREGGLGKRSRGFSEGDSERSAARAARSSGLALPETMDADQEEQLRQQKEMQRLEARVREAAAREAMPGARVVGEGGKPESVAERRMRELYEERLRDSGSPADTETRMASKREDTVEDAEATGGVIDGGTWEHRKRAKEMLKTAETALNVTLKAKGAHHMGQYLPKEELDRFLKKADKAAKGEQMEAEEDFEKNKLAEDNIGFKMLKKAGWKEGEGLGKEGGEKGTAAPVNMAAGAGDGAGVGVKETHEVAEGDNEFEQYRKRMMLAYRFRPNPLNNPRRSYY